MESSDPSVRIANWRQPCFLRPEPEEIADAAKDSGRMGNEAKAAGRGGAANLNGKIIDAASLMIGASHYSRSGSEKSMDNGENRARLFSKTSKSEPFIRHGAGPA